MCILHGNKECIMIITIIIVVVEISITCYDVTAVNTGMSGTKEIQGLFV